MAATSYSSSSSAAGAGGGGAAAATAAGLKTYFKTPEGRYKLQYEKAHSAAVLRYNHGGKTVSQVPVDAVAVLAPTRGI